jgi:hypothetical protein
MKYAKYVLVNEEAGMVVWHESYDKAVAEQQVTGGAVYNADTTDHDTLQRALTAARHNMGVE